MYDEIMALWRAGNFMPLSVYLNNHGIYSNTNIRQHKNRIGSCEWINPKDGSMEHDLLVLGVMLFPSELRYTNKGEPK